LFAVKPPPIINPEAVLCQALFNKFALDERLKIREWGATLNAVIQAAIDVTNETMEADQRLEFVEVSSRFAGHEPCGSDGEWVRFVGLINSAVRDGSFHPREVGQAMMARIIACHLDVFPDANTPSTQVTAYAMTGCLAHATAEVAESGSPSPVPTTQGST
jgi:hypothetical protein